MSDFIQPGSIAHLAMQGFSKIQKLSKSSLITEKLSAINMILYMMILGITLTFYLTDHSMDTMSLVVMFVFSLMLSAISLLLYGPLLEVIVNLSKNKIEGLRISITILFVDLTIAIAAFTFRNEFLMKTALALLGFQLIIQLIVGIIGLIIPFPAATIKDKKVDPSQIWDYLGKLSTIIAIISFMIDISMILLT